MNSTMRLLLKSKISTFWPSSVGVHISLCRKPHRKFFLHHSSCIIMRISPFRHDILDTRNKKEIFLALNFDLKKLNMIVFFMMNNFNFQLIKWIPNTNYIRCTLLYFDVLKMARCHPWDNQQGRVDFPFFKGQGTHSSSHTVQLQYMIYI